MPHLASSEPQRGRKTSNGVLPDAFGRQAPLSFVGVIQTFVVCRCHELIQS